MRITGIILTIVGAIWLLIAINMDITVSSWDTYGTDNTVNLGLISKRQNHLFVAGLLALIGVLLIIFGGSGKSASVTADRIDGGQAQRNLPSEPPTERDLSSDSYRLWLAEKYAIRRNELFDQFVLDQQTFDTLDQALINAHEREMKALEQRKQALAVKEREAEARQVAEADRIAQYAEQRQQDQKAFKRIAVLFVAVLILLSPIIIPAVQKSLANAKIEATRKEAAKLAEEKRIGEMLTKVGLKPGDGWSGLYEDKDDETSKYSTCDNLPANLIRFQTRHAPEIVAEEFEKQLGAADELYRSLSQIENGDLSREWAATGKRPAIQLFAFRDRNVWLCISSKR